MSISQQLEAQFSIFINETVVKFYDKIFMINIFLFALESTLEIELITQLFASSNCLKNLKHKVFHYYKSLKHEKSPTNPQHRSEQAIQTRFRKIQLIFLNRLPDHTKTTSHPMETPGGGSGLVEVKIYRNRFGDQTVPRSLYMCVLSVVKPAGLA